MKIKQYDVFWTDLDPTKGGEINKARPCVVISPQEMNDNLRTIIVAPVTSKGREGYPTRTKIEINGISGWIVIDQIRAIDKLRLTQKIGTLDTSTISTIKNIIKEMLVD